MNKIDTELINARRRVRDLKKLKWMQRKLHRLEESSHKPHPYFVFVDLIDCFIALVKHPKVR